MASGRVLSQSLWDYNVRMVKIYLYLATFITSRYDHGNHESRAFPSNSHFPVSMKGNYVIQEMGTLDMG